MSRRALWCSRCFHTQARLNLCHRASAGAGLVGRSWSPLGVARQQRRQQSTVAADAVRALAVPEYVQVPIQPEEPDSVLAEMPELLLCGPHLDSPLPPAAMGGSNGKQQQQPHQEQQNGEAGQPALSGQDVARSALTEPIRLDLATPPAPASPSVPSSSASSSALHAPLTDEMEIMRHPKTRFARLDNGVRIAAVDRQGLCASLGLFVHTGSRYAADASSAFLPHALELMAFRSSAHLSHMRTLKTLEQLGAATLCRAGREDLLYQFDVLREYVPVVLPLMLANLLCPALLPEEVAAAHENVREVRQNLEENVESLICELLHITAYKGNSLGFPLYAAEEDLPQITAESLAAFIRRECTAERLILVGVNVDFKELCKWTARSFAEHQQQRELFPFAAAAAADAVETATAVAAAAAAEVRDVEEEKEQHRPHSREMAPAHYTGGDHRVEKPNPLCHIMLGWEVPGGWNGPLLAAVTVLQMFLGGGGSFSTGGPGKGMHTRLYTEVLNRHHWVESCQASSVMYADSGLFTIYGTVVPENADQFVTVMARIFQQILAQPPVAFSTTSSGRAVAAVAAAAAKSIGEEEMQRAKNALKASIHMNLEMRAVMMEDLGRQLILSDKVGTAQDFGRIVDAVTAEDLRSCLRQCLQARPTVVAYGAIQKVPSYEQIEKQFTSAAAQS